MRFVSCHRDPKRSFFYKGKQFPLCARCTGIYIGYLSVFLMAFKLIEISLLMSFVFIVPAVVDGTVQYYTRYESNNLIRLITGFIGGVGLMGIATQIGIQIAQFLLSLF